jgi:hypothetical protein
MKITIETEIEVDGDEVLVTVDAEFTAGCAGRMYMSNGDPGYPDEPDEVDIVTVTGEDGVEYEPTKEELQRIDEEVRDAAWAFRYDGVIDE